MRSFLGLCLLQKPTFNYVYAIHKIILFNSHSNILFNSHSIYMSFQIFSILGRWPYIC